MIGPDWDDYGPMFDDIDAEHYADAENFEDHYADEINGNAEPPVDDIPTVRYGELRNAPGQLRLSLGAAY